MRKAIHAKKGAKRPKGAVHQSKLFSGKNKMKNLTRIGKTEWFKEIP